MKKVATIFTVLILVFVSVYFIVNNYVNNEKQSIWDYVTNDAAIVYERSTLADSKDYFKNSAILQLYNKLNAKLEFINNGGDSSISINESILNGVNLISFHVISNDSFGMTYFFDLSENNFQTEIIKLIENIKKKEFAISGSRKYLDQTIEELNFGEKTLSYIISDNILILSFEAFLIEDVIRSLQQNSKNSFLKVNQSLATVTKLSNDDGNVYLNTKGLNKLLEIFVKDKSNTLNNFARRAFYDVSFVENRLFLNGFTMVENNDFLKSFSNQSAIKNEFDYYVPIGSSMVTKYLTSNAREWHNNLKVYWSIHENKHYLIRNDFLKIYDYDIDQTFSWIKDGLCHIEITNDTSVESLLLISTNDVNQALNQLNNFAAVQSKAIGDSLYAENYGDVVITEIKLTNFPQLVFGSQFKGFENVYFTSINNNIVFGSSINAIKNLLTSIENENTWGKSVNYNSFMESGLQETNLSLVYDLSRIWPSLTPELKSKWKKFIDDNYIAFKSFKMLSLQFSRVDDDFYTSIILQNEVVDEVVKEEVLQINQNISFTSPLVSKPFIVKNHNTNLFEVLIQDSLNNIHFISNDGNKKWSISLDSKLTSDIYQIDFFKNGKLQYYFTTEKSINLIDRLGNKVDNYPLVTNYQIENSSVIDYDNSKNYRFILNDDRGNLFLYNKEGKLLEGWNPKELTGKLSFKPFHIRIRGRDCFVALQQDGKLNVFNRRGEMEKGFPLQIDARFESDIFVETGSNYSNTILHLISRSGHLYKVNLEGKVINSEELYKQSKEARFQIINDALKKTYIIARQEQNRLVIINSNNVEILAKDYVNTDQLKIQYYYFSPDNQLFVVTDTNQGFTYLYKLDGTLVGSKPLNSDYEIGVIYSESKNQYIIYSASNDTYNQIVY